MKKGMFCSLAVLTAVFLVVGCASAPNVNTPDWLSDFPPDDAIWGIGSARQSSEQLSMTAAESFARVSIARQLDAKVKAMFTNYMRDAGTVGSQTALSLQEDVSRQVTSMQLNGSRPIKRWKAPDGTWWYLVEYRISDARAALGNIIDSEAARFAEFKADEALRILDAELAKSERPALVNE
ncbi:hypothetical protein FACS189493_5840 [Spirochaetia bacterium]|nr:hypothetical protein FACS189493_5840 [Spirochaetia bacterium]